MFSGLFTFEGICAVACDSNLTRCMAIDSVGELVLKSMLNVEYEGPVLKYRLTESTRAYALERLAAEGETRSVASRAARYLALRFKIAEDSAPATNPESASELHQLFDDGCRALE